MVTLQTLFVVKEALLLKFRFEKCSFNELHNECVLNSETLWVNQGHFTCIKKSKNRDIKRSGKNVLKLR